MENASKALLIAGAILIAIVLISLGVMILGQGSDLVKNADMSSAEISTYNSEFEAYVGTNVRGNVVRQMLDKIAQHNRSNNSDYSKQIGAQIIGYSTAFSTAIVDYSATSTPNTVATSSIETGSSYNVQPQYNSGGLISKLLIKKNER